MANRKKPLVDPHPSSRRDCKICSVPHSINSHRFHVGAKERPKGTGPFCKTHKKDRHCTGAAIEGIFDPATIIDDIAKAVGLG